VHIVATLGRLFDEIVVVAAPGEVLPETPAAVVHDEVAYQGPVSGIRYGLRAVRGDSCFVTSCDSAFLDAGVIAHLLARAPGFDAVVPRWGGLLQPLHAVYRPAVLPHLEAQIARGALRLMDLFDHVRTLVIEEDEIRPLDPEGLTFSNINTPEQYADALARWARRKAV
jgi:molybdopterin-guanine dinucleotide biosynthesis protein A